MVTRERRPPQGLIRLHLDGDGKVQVDRSRQARGRGAWITPSKEAFRRLLLKPHVLRRSLGVVPSQLGPLLSDAIEDADLHLEAAIVRAWRSGLLRIASTTDFAHRWTLLSIDAPLSPPPAGAESLPLPWSSERLGRLIGRPPVTTLQLATGSPSLEVLRRLQWRSSLGYGTGPSASNPGQGHPKPSETVRTESPGVGPRIGVLLCTSARRVPPSNSRNRGRSPASRQTQSGDSTIASGVPCDVTLA